MSSTTSFLRLVADGSTQSIHQVFLLVRLLAIAPFVQPLLGSLLVQCVDQGLLEVVCGLLGGGDLGEDSDR